MKYTKTQLIQGMFKWNKEYLDNPDKFGAETITGTKKEAKEQVDYLLSLID